MRISLWGLLPAATLAFLLTSCSGQQSTQPVKVQVLYKKAPAVGAIVVFHPEGDESTKAIKPGGEVGADGYCNLTSYRQSPGGGAPPGKYLVSVYYKPAKSGAAKSGAEDHAAVPDPVVDEGDEEERNAKKAKSSERNYADYKNSGFKAEVKAGEENSFTFNLE